MKCPTCGQHTPDAWKPLYQTADGGGITHGLRAEYPHDPHTVQLQWMECANPQCRELVIVVQEEWRDTSAGEIPTPRLAGWFARPRAVSRHVDPLVADPYRSDYVEATAIIDLSPRMSAVLSRRILADLLERFADLTQFTLSDRIDAFVNDSQYPPGIRENLHHLREIGNFGAHTQKNDQAEVIDVTRDEAEWTLEIIDRLFDYFIVGPERDKQMRAAFDQKIAESGRNPPKTVDT